MRRVKKMIKGFCGFMKNEKISEVIDASKNAIIDISKDKDVKILISNMLIGVGSGLIIIGTLIRIS